MPQNTMTAKKRGNLRETDYKGSGAQQLFDLEKGSYASGELLKHGTPIVGSDEESKEEQSPQRKRKPPIYQLDNQEKINVVKHRGRAQSSQTKRDGSQF